MSQSRIVLVITLLAALTMVVGCGADSQLEGQVTKLAERVDSLETKIRTLQRTAPAAAAGNAQLEQQGKTALAGITQLVSQGKIDEAKALLTAESPKYASAKVGNSFRSLGRELAVIGKDSPASWGIEKWFQGQNDVDLSGKGTTVVVFWESWCPHCRREVPKMQKMYDTYKGKGLQVLGLTKINKSSTEDIVKEFISSNNVSYPIAKEDGSVSKYFAVSGIPAAAVVKNGKVVWRGHPVRITDAMLKNWLDS